MAAVTLILPLLFSFCGAAIEPEDKNYTASVGDDVALTWIYDNADRMFSVDWSFKSNTAAMSEPIMTQLAGNNAEVKNGYKVEHNGDGNITLQTVTTDSSGTYFCVVTYNLISLPVLPVVTGTATLTVHATTVAPTTAPTTVPRTDKTSDTDAIVGGTVGGVLGLCCIAAAVVGIRHLYKKKKGRTITLSTVEGGKVTLSCPFPKSVTYPEWRGPPGLTTYTRMNDTSGDINPAAPAFGRLQYASNKRDLILSNAVISDSGDYTCSYTGQGNHTITLKVNRANCTGGIDLADNGQLLQENPV